MTDTGMSMNETRIRNELEHKIENKNEEKNKKTQNTKNKENFEKPNNTNLNIMYTNIDSLSNKVSELEIYAHQYEADIILITESLSKNSHDNFDNVFQIKGYHCLEDNTGRGVCIFYKECIEIENLTKINELYHPSLFINIKKSQKPLNLGLVYRSPNSDSPEQKKLLKQLNFATKKLKNLVIFGDFNHPHIDWEYFSCNKNEDHVDSLFLFETIKINTNQLVTDFTHHKPNCKPTLIDLIITKKS